MQGPGILHVHHGDSFGHVRKWDRCSRVSMGASHGTGYRQDQCPSGRTVQKSGNIGHLHAQCREMQLAKQLNSEKILVR